MPPTTSVRPLLRVARAVAPEACGANRFQQVRSRAPFSSVGSSRKAASAGGGKLPTGTPGEASSDQAVPLGPYYDAIIITPQPIPDVKPEDPPTSSPNSPRTTVNIKKTPAGGPPPSKKKQQQPQPQPQQPPKPKPKNTPPASSASATAAGDSATTPTSTSTPTPATSSSAPSPPESPEPYAPPATAQEKARIIFGSRLAGPIQRAERLAALRDRSTMIAGVLVPPRPEEPDNCCMSGCVNCVWDRFRDDMEEWVAASAQAERALAAQQQAQEPPKGRTPSAPSPGPSPGVGPSNAVSMDDDGGGSETNWQADLKKAESPKIAKDLWDEELYKNVPVGIREFMKQEKRLKEKHMREGTFGA
ncbi:hypothetical protein SLS62_007277 [Diatrype stigma]|uniref:Oxidoreductase-like domain-containing protein n=1 Tax=Diatrype stigma TaxID=117547 RepID=A0AAN9YNG2_9PEZI